MRRTGAARALAGILLAAAGILPAVPAHAAPAAGLTATIALGNCSAALVRYPSSVDGDRALMLTNGHCYTLIGAGEVLEDRASRRTGQLLSPTGATLGTVQADLLLYGTMTGTDVALYRLTDTFAGIASRYGVSALTISAAHPADGTAVTIPSGYWKRTWNCRVNGFVGTLREDQWTFRDAIRYDTGCEVIHGTSGSPILDGEGAVIGINNTVNDDGESCTLNNPCEVDANGTTTVRKGQGYGEQTYWFTTCLDASNTLDLTIEGCLLPKPRVV